MTTMTVQLRSIPDTHAFVANDSDALVAPLSPSTASPTSRVSIHCRSRTHRDRRPPNSDVEVFELGRPRSRGGQQCGSKSMQKALPVSYNRRKTTTGF